MNHTSEPASSSGGSIASRLWRRGYVPAELIAGAAAGGLAAFVLLPIDTVKVGRWHCCGCRCRLSIALVFPPRIQTWKAKVGRGYVSGSAPASSQKSRHRLSHEPRSANSLCQGHS